MAEKKPPTLAGGGLVPDRDLEVLLLDLVNPIAGLALRGLDLETVLLGGSREEACRAAGGELEQIQLLLGHASVQTTERYLGTKQDLVHAPNDGIKLRVVQ